MGKSDDLQRMREEQHARRELEAKRRDAEAKRAPAPPPPPTLVVLPPEAVAAPADQQRPVATRDRAVVSKIEKSPAPSRKKAIASKSKSEPKAALGEETGRCPSCGKVKALNRGLVIDHQKGLGKACAGSRKRPA